MVYLAKYYPIIASLKKISQAEGVPFYFLEKIMGKLEKAKLLKSKKGVQGGYFLAKNPRKITAGQIVKILEGTTAPVNCLLCGRSRKCASKKVWAKLENALENTLNSITLKDLIHPVKSAKSGASEKRFNGVK